jgi:hypothetical protein
MTDDDACRWLDRQQALATVRARRQSPAASEGGPAAAAVESHSTNMVEQAVVMARAILCGTAPRTATAAAISRRSLIDRRANLQEVLWLMSAPTGGWPAARLERVRSRTARRPRLPCGSPCQTGRDTSADTQAHAAGPIVWAAPSLVRTGQADPPGESATASTSAAMGEYESFQIAVRAPTGALTNVNVVASNLARPGGALIDASNLTLYRDHYVYVRRSSPNRDGKTAPKIPSRAGSGGRRSGERITRERRGGAGRPHGALVDPGSASVRRRDS